MTLMRMPKCSVSRGSIEENNECKQNLLLRRNFSDADDLAKQYGGLIYKQGTQYSRLPTFHTFYDFLLFFALVKNFLPIFHFTMLAGLDWFCTDGSYIVCVGTFVTLCTCLLTALARHVINYCPQIPNRIKM